MIENIWEGIYDRFDQCPAHGMGYESDRWVRQETERMQNLLQATKNEKTLPSVATNRTDLLPLLAVTTAANSTRNKVTILDVGGGLGSTYISVTAVCGNPKIIDYHIVESKNICLAGKTWFENDNQVHFYDHLPEDIQAVDIVYLSSSIQYIEDWKGLLKESTGYDPLYIILADVPAGDIPTYATVQNYYESKIPYWFFNINDIISVMSSIQYELLFRSFCAGVYLGKEQPMPQANFPVEYRVGDSCNLLFNRNVR